MRLTKSFFAIVSFLGLALTVSAINDVQEQALERFSGNWSGENPYLSLDISISITPGSFIKMNASVSNIYIKDAGKSDVIEFAPLGYNEDNYIHTLFRFFNSTSIQSELEAVIIERCENLYSLSPLWNQIKYTINNTTSGCILFETECSKCAITDENERWRIMKDFASFPIEIASATPEFKIMHAVWALTPHGRNLSCSLLGTVNYYFGTMRDDYGPIGAKFFDAEWIPLRTVELTKQP